MRRFSVTARIAAILTFVMVMSVGVAFGQQVTGTILGRVTDTTGAVVPGATIQIQNPATGFSRNEQADSDGRYLGSNLPLGSYTVTVQKQGFKTLVRSGIQLTVGSQETVNAELAVGDVQQHVEVTGEAPQIETTNATISGLVNQDQMRDLPLNGRNVDSLALLSPGTLANHAASQNITIGMGLHISVNGARPQENLFLLDGTVVNDPASGRGSASGQALGVEGILEFRVLTHSFSAEYGRNTGAVISAVTRSGTNQFHGAAYEFVRNDLFDAQNFFNTGALPEFRRNQFGAAAGGPIKKDRIFFFANYEGLRQRQGNTIIATVPDANARLGIIPGLAPISIPLAVQPYVNLYPPPSPNGKNFGDGTAQYISSPVQPTTEDYAMMRMDFRLSDKDTFYWRYVHDPSTTTSFLPTPTFAQVITADDNFVVLSETHVFSGASLNEFRFAFNRTIPFSDSFPVTSVAPSLSFVSGKPFGTITFAAGTTIGSSAISSLGTSSGALNRWPQNLFQYSDTFSYLRGPHSLKFGVDVERLQLNDLYTVRSRGTYTFSGGLQSFLNGTPSLFAILQPSSNTERGWRRIMFSAFVQDDFRVRPNLTLNLGLRYEDFSSPVEASGRSAALINITDTANTPGPPFLTPKANFAPRIGMAWDPTGSGKTSVRLGAGMFYSHLDGYTWFAPSTNNTNFMQNIQISNPLFPNALGGVIPAQTLADQGVQYNSKTPAVIHWNLGVQRQLLRTLSLEASYIGSGGYHLPRLAELDLRIPTIVSGSQIFSKTGARINPNFSSNQEIVTDANSNYHGLQVVLTKALSAGLQFQVFYTYSKTMSVADEIVSGQTLSTSAHAQDSFNPRADYSLSTYNQKGTLTGNWVYQMPWDKQLTGRLTKALLGGWATNGILTYGSGLPFYISSGFNSSFNGDSTSPDRPNLNAGYSNNPTTGTTSGPASCTALGGPAAGIPLHTTARWFDPCAFSLPVTAVNTGTYGNLGRNTVIGPRLVQLDLALVKTTALTERTKLEFRAESFNLFNHPNLGLPNNSLFSSTGKYAGNAGAISSVSTNSRQLQLGMKFSF